MRKNLHVQDIYSSQFHRQFTETTANLLADTSKYFKVDDVILMITEIEAAGAYTITFVDAQDQLPTRGGSGNTQYLLPILCKKLTAAVGVTRISGYYVTTKTFQG